MMLSQSGAVREHCARWCIDSTASQSSSLQSLDGASGLRLRTKMARCSSLRHVFSSVASESGVPSDFQTFFQSMEYETCLFHVASQLGHASPTRRLVR